MEKKEKFKIILGEQLMDFFRELKEKGDKKGFEELLKALEKFLELEPKHSEAPKIKELIKKIKKENFR